ncbi:MAG: AraC family transcriptional regulator [Clostridia bacterium]|nr:AraC family transcriptional regulator [Clostridia bacterium]
MKYIINENHYFEPGTVRITVTSNQHHGKVWQHTHGFYEFVYIDKGFSLHSYNGKSSVLTSGDLFAIFPGDVHSYNSAYHTDLYNCLFYLEDIPGLREEILRLPGIDWDRTHVEDDCLPIIRVPLNERRDLVALLERIKWERNNKAIGWELNIKGLLINFLITYSRLLTAARTSHPDENVHESDGRGYCGYIYSTLRFVEENYSRDISIKDIADYTGLSADYLSKQFKAVISMTPTEYVRKFRVAKSMDMLKSTDMSIADIAAATGFGSISLFSRVFKQNIGVSPAAFRKE